MDLPLFPAPIIWLIVELVLMSGLFIGLFRLRRFYGMTPFLMTLGALQYLQVVLAMSVYVEVSPGLLISPGSTVLFVSTLFAIMLMYIRAGAEEARRLIFGVLTANLILSAITPLFGLQLNAEHTTNLLGVPTELFFHNPRLLLAGTLTLFVDVLLIIVLYEWINRRLSRHQFLSIWLTISGVVIADSVMFSVGAFAGTDNFALVLWSGLVGKLCSGTAYTALLYLYLRYSRPVDELPVPAEYQGVFHRLSFRRKYEMTLALVGRDPLTGLQNRGAFDATMERCFRCIDEEPIALLLVDIDHFKSVNDTYGHPVGDHVLQMFAQTLESCVRAEDIYRIGGEELAVVVEGADLHTAARLGERIRAELAEDVAAGRYQPSGGITITIGVACAPADGMQPSELMAVCDRRLYAGKRSGRDRVVSYDPDRQAL